MLNCTPMTKEDRVVEAAKELNDDEKRRAAERILKLVPTYDPELEASLARALLICARVEPSTQTT